MGSVPVSKASLRLGDLRSVKMLAPREILNSLSGMMVKHRRTRSHSSFWSLRM
jgi:hypothetical protein